MNYNRLMGQLVLMIVLISALSSAVVVQSVQAPTLAPGKEGSMIITLSNPLEDSVEDVSFALILEEVPFISTGGSEKSTNELREGREKDFSFTIKPSYDAQPGDYQIPYEIRYSLDEEQFVREGTIGVHVDGAPELRMTLDSVTPVVGMSDTITLTVVNDGLADARFVSVSVRGEGLVVLSDKETYIGGIDSDDFETASFEVQYTKPKAALEITLTYRDLDNKRLTIEDRLPVLVYDKEDAIARGIIEPNRTPFYIGGIVLVIVLWFVWRSYRKRRRTRLASAG